MAFHGGWQGDADGSASLVESLEFNPGDGSGFMSCNPDEPFTAETRDWSIGFGLMLDACGAVQSRVAKARQPATSHIDWFADYGICPIEAMLGWHWRCSQTVADNVKRFREARRLSGPDVPLPEFTHTLGTSFCETAVAVVGYRVQALDRLLIGRHTATTINLPVAERFRFEAKQIREQIPGLLRRWRFPNVDGPTIQQLIELEIGNFPPAVDFSREYTMTEVENLLGGCGPKTRKTLMVDAGVKGAGHGERGFTLKHVDVVKLLEYAAKHGKTFADAAAQSLKTLNR